MGWRCIPSCREYGGGCRLDDPGGRIVPFTRAKFAPGSIRNRLSPRFELLSASIFFEPSSTRRTRRLRPSRQACRYFCKQRLLSVRTRCRRGAVRRFSTCANSFVRSRSDPARPSSSSAWRIPERTAREKLARSQRSATVASRCFAATSAFQFQSQPGAHSDEQSSPTVSEQRRPRLPCARASHDVEQPCRQRVGAGSPSKAAAPTSDPCRNNAVIARLRIRFCNSGVDAARNRNPSLVRFCSAGLSADTAKYLTRVWVGVIIKFRRPDHEMQRITRNFALRCCSTPSAQLMRAQTLVRLLRPAGRWRTRRGDDLAAFLQQNSHGRLRSRPACAAGMFGAVRCSAGNIGGGEGGDGVQRPHGYGASRCEGQRSCRTTDPVDHCKVKGTTDQDQCAAASAEWNGKFVMGGQGASPACRKPGIGMMDALSKGYATQTDTGHTGTVAGGEWAMGDMEPSFNYRHLAAPRTSETSKRWLGHYGRRPNVRISRAVRRRATGVMRPTLSR